MNERQEILDRFYWQHGPCCAGCDWWRHLNAVAGECTRSVPAPASERFAMLGITGASIQASAGHILTRRDHRCGEFRDTFDWGTLPLVYRTAVGAAITRAERRDP